MVLTYGLGSHSDFVLLNCFTRLTGDSNSYLP